MSGTSSRKEPVAVALTCGVFAVMYTTIALSNPFVGFLSDDSLYLLMADIYSPFVDATLPVYNYVAEQSQLPPLYPLLLGLLGGGSDSIMVAKFWTAIFMALAQVSIYLWLRSAELERAYAAALAIFVALLPATVLHTIDVWSEGIFTGLLFFALWMLNSLHKHPEHLPRAILIGVLVASAILTRTIGIVLLPAIAVAAPKIGWRATVTIAATVATIIACASPLAMGTEGVSYTELLRLRVIDDGPMNLLHAVSNALQSTWTAFGYNLATWRTFEPLQSFYLSLVVLLVIVGALAVRHTQGPVVVVIFGYMGIVLVWPFPMLMSRFLYPVMPILLFLGYHGARALWRKESAGATRLARVYIVSLFLVAAPGIYRLHSRALTSVDNPMVDQFRTSRYWLEPERGDNQPHKLRFLASLQHHLPSVSERVPANDCIYTVSPGLILLYAKRAAWLPPDAETLKISNGPRNCRYFYAIARSGHGRPPLYPLRKIRSEAKLVVAHRNDYGLQDPSGEESVIGILLRRERPDPR